jgi:NAD(P)-dependent dehydrogenase (short-subunit alcohol dehydrogenase family)
MQNGQHIGKIVIKFPKNPDDLPTAQFSDKLVLKPNYSYFLPGGLGGLGQAIAVWLAGRGARHLIFLSRSGAKNIDKAFFEELAEMGCTCQTFSGDISKLKDVKEVVSQAKNPIAGVMHMAMVLRVCFKTTLDTTLLIATTLGPSPWSNVLGGLASCAAT